MTPERLWSPRRGAGVCADCFTFIEPEFERCLVCQRMQRPLAAMVPIAYSVHGGTLHHDIASYKRDADPSVDDTTRRLARMLAGFLAAHERCLAAAAGVAGFELIAVIPSGRGLAHDRHPLDSLIAARIPSTAGRLQRLLERTAAPTRPRRFDPGRFAVSADLTGASVLLIDDMWTSGASAQSAAAALRAAGATRVAAIVIGRHLNRRRFEPERLLEQRAAPLDLSACAYCAAEATRADDRQRTSADRRSQEAPDALPRWPLIETPRPGPEHRRWFEETWMSALTWGLAGV